MTADTQVTGPGGAPPPARDPLSGLFGVRGLPTLVISLAVALVCVEVLYLGAAEVGVRLLWPSFPTLDGWIARAVHSVETPALTALFLALTFLCIAPVVVAQTAAAIGYLVSTRRLLLAWALLIVMIGEFSLEFVTKNVVQRARPDVFRLAEATGFSFPSGHALAAVSLYGFLAFVVLWPRSRARVFRVALIALGVLLPLGIGLSRIYLGVHYPSDVLGGWLGGAIWLTCAIVVLRVLARRTEVAANPDAATLT